MKKVLFCLLFVFSIFSFQVFTNTTVLATSHINELIGWAWSDNIGWISFSNTTDGTLTPYGVDVSPTTGTGIFSGYALYDAGAGNNGWINFAPLETPPGPVDYSSSIPPHSAELDWGTNKVTGWARACAGYANPTSCSGATSVDGWDGWISLSGTTPTYGVNFDPLTNKLSGFAWGSGVIGWIDFEPPVGGGVVFDGTPSNNPPLAHIINPSSIPSPALATKNVSISFTGTGTDNLTLPGNLNYEWYIDADCSFPDSSIPENTASSFPKTYSSTGTFTMCLRVQDEAGLYSPMDTRTILVSNPQCSDGIDNDGDNGVDGPNPALIDPSCAGGPNGTDESAIPVITSCFGFGGLPDGICQIESGETILNCPADCFRIREI